MSIQSLPDLNKPIIKHRYTGEILFKGDFGMTSEQLLKKAIRARADLRFADLRFMKLRGANFCYADFYGANFWGVDFQGANLIGTNFSDSNVSDVNFCGSNLERANFCGADCTGSNFSDANLYQTNLMNANLFRAYVNNKKLIGGQPFFSIGPMGRDGEFLKIFITSCGVIIFDGRRIYTREQFALELFQMYGHTKHGTAYCRALALIDMHVDQWTPESDDA